MNREIFYPQWEHDTQIHSAWRKSINANTAVFFVVATEKGIFMYNKLTGWFTVQWASHWLLKKNPHRFWCSCSRLLIIVLPFWFNISGYLPDLRMMTLIKYVVTFITCSHLTPSLKKNVFFKKSTSQRQIYNNLLHWHCPKNLTHPPSCLAFAASANNIKVDIVS